MPGRTYDNREVIEWAYVGLICVALAFITMTSVVAGSVPSDHALVSDTINRNACLISEKGTSHQPMACELEAGFPIDQQWKTVQSLLGPYYAAPFERSFEKREE